MLRQLWRQLCIDARIRFAALFARRRIRSRAEEELQFHLAMLEQRHIDRGLAPGEARAQARRELGNPTLFTERTLDSWRYAFVSTLMQDVRYGLRGLRRNPGFAATAVLSLALGIGANTAIFRLFDALLFRPLPVKSPEELVLVTRKVGDQRSLMLTNGDRGAFSDSETLTGLCASRHSRIRLTRSGESQFVEGMFAGGNCFALLGVGAALGRTITETDNLPSADALIAVLSYGYWQRQFGADPKIIGQNIDLDGRSFMIAGVAPPGFIGLEPGAPADIIVPLTSFHSPLLANPDVHWLRLLGRRKPGVSVQQVQADLEVRASRIPRTGKANRVTPAERLEVVPAGSGFGAARMEFSLPLRLLMGAVALVLLIACANLASLLLARIGGRRQEIDLRIALGAGRSRLLRQLLTESVLLSGLGGLAGTGIAGVTSPLLVRAMSRGRMAILVDLSMDGRTLLFIALTSLLTGVLFGIVPALRAVRHTNITGALHGTRLKTGSRRWSTALIVAQVAFCVVVLVSAGLLLGSLRKLQQVDPGFRKEHVLLLTIRPDNYKEQSALSLHREILRRLTAIPGVQTVTTFMDAPLGGSSITTKGFSINEVGPGFFEAMGIPLLAGRALTEQDAVESRPVAVVSARVARQFFPDRSPLGQHLDVFHADRVIVGIAGDARYRSLRQPAEPMVYVPEFGPGSYAIRTAGDPRALAGSVRRELRDVARDVPVWSLDTLDALVDGTLVQERMVSKLCGLFGLFALLIASIGLYGRLSYSVAERTGEIGVRMALGARQSGVVWMVLRDALTLTLCGIAIGLPLALASTTLLRTLLFAVTPTDAKTLVAIAGVIAGVSMIAGYIPARRAARVDPVVALRAE
ncbi:MAG TPA: ABC transporter permease [Bryobacteraceae bacterium]|nr:ABC transporter permease [Bryobacteraceae bacterium]